MLSLPNDRRYPTIDSAPEQRRRRTLEALGLQMEMLSRANPVLMIFEDAHWTDPTSLEAFGRAVDRIPSLRVLLIVTFRPEFEPPWIGRPYVTALTLNRLAQRDVDAMIDRVVGNKLIPANIRRDIIERADGIPLFRRGNDEGGAGGGERRRGAAGHCGRRSVTRPSGPPASLHAPADGAARPARLGERSSTDRRGNRENTQQTSALSALSTSAATAITTMP